MNPLAAKPLRITGWKVVLAAIALASLALRVLPAWNLVFMPGTVNFQEFDAWFHIHTAHNLLAHFPHRSGFDPYGLFPGGQDIPTGPFWDYLIATTAWILALGSPSAIFVDRVAAWLPAILGALFTFPVFFVARRLFGPAAAAFAALWIAFLPGGFLWLTHLGLADHHAAEGFLAFVALACLCTAVESKVTARAKWSAAGGLAMGLFLATRPAGIFVPALFACAAVWEPEAAGPVLVAAAVAAAVFASAGGVLWSNYTWLALAGTLAAAAVAVGVAALARRRRWSLAVYRLAMLGTAAAGLAIAGLAHPALLESLTSEVRQVAGAEPSPLVATVQEAQPIYRSGQTPGLPSIVEQLGTIWIPVLPMLVWVLWRALHTRRPALTLFAIWSLVMTAGVLFQVRMIVYFGPVAAVLSGAACALAANIKPRVVGRAAPVVLAFLIIALNLPQATAVVRTDHGPSADWRRALAWLRRNSPEPFADGAVWSRWYPRRESSREISAFPAWGVAADWQYGYAIEQIAHRVPMSNGTQAGEEAMARFFLETSPEAAVTWLRAVGARYVIADPDTPWIAGYTSFFPVAVMILNRDPGLYVRRLLQNTPQGVQALPVYLPEYYRSMALRFYAADAAATPGTGPWVFETNSGEGGAGAELITGRRHFDSEREAYAYRDAHPFSKLTIGCLDPVVSCFALPPVEGMRLVYSSDPRPFTHGHPLSTVKIFQVTP